MTCAHVIDNRHLLAYTCHQNDLTQWHAQVGVYCPWHVHLRWWQVCWHLGLIHMSSCPHILFSSSCPRALVSCIRVWNWRLMHGIWGWCICLATLGRRIWLWTLDAYGYPFLTHMFRDSWCICLSTLNAYVYALLTHVLMHAWRICLGTLDAYAYALLTHVLIKSVFWGCASRLRALRLCLQTPCFDRLRALRLCLQTPCFTASRLRALRLCLQRPLSLSPPNL